jgi:transcriptional regulator with XRE-family HTH domain
MALDARTRELDAEKLRRLRQACGWSQERLAEKLKVSKKTIERWERGKPIFPRHLARLEELFEADIALAETPAVAATDIGRFSETPDKERALLIHNVRRVWIDGVLGQLLSALRLIELKLEPQVDVVEHPWADVPMPSPAPAGLKANPSVERAFAFFGQALLILGAPGGGKTTLMLQLADVLLDDAEFNEDAFVPVVFTLSSWAAEKRSLQDWLIDELNRCYQIASGTARKWVEQGVILPLLDGLDEVPLDDREACVAAINSFRVERQRDQGVVPMVVCCRREDYEALSVRLTLGGALIVHPLGRDCVEDYLRQGEPHFAAARAVLREDPGLFGLIDTPLMLGIFVQACRQPPANRPAVGSSRQDHRKWLFDTYVDAMFERRGRSHQYPQGETICWLAGLAALMRKSRQTVLYLEWMQPSYLPSRALINAAVLGPLLVSGITTGLLFGFGAELVLGDERALWLGIALGTLGPIAFWLLGYGGEIKPVETLRWSRMALTKNWEKRAFGALLFGLFFGSFGWIISGRTLGIMLAALSTALFFLFFELPERTSESRVVPNQGVWRSMTSGIVTGLIGTAVFSMLLAAHLNAAAGLAFGAGLGLVTGLLNGGHTCIQHAILRTLLWRCGRAPLDYVHFLDFATQLVLLRKVGGGYMFIHALFQEHFAALLPAEAAVAQTAENEGTASGP